MITIYTHPAKIDERYDSAVSDLLSKSHCRVFLVPPGCETAFKKDMIGISDRDVFIPSLEGRYSQPIIDSWNKPIYGIGGQFGSCFLRTYESLLSEFRKSDAKTLTYYIIPEAVNVEVNFRKKIFIKGLRDNDTVEERLQKDSPAYRFSPESREEDWKIIRLSEIISIGNRSLDRKFLSSTLSEFLRKNEENRLEGILFLNPESLCIQSIKRA
ncbi:MAG TPA: hypothetical protein VJI75_05675 [Candidatus Nanoarchaeia archaeon]|nr:hypothetical protein [Candidatus Nanoarchaeia archaeon]